MRVEPLRLPKTHDRFRFVHRVLAHTDAGFWAILLLFLALLPLSVPRIYATDEVRYYAYLRSLSFDGDLDFRNEFQHFADIGLQNGDPALYNALIRDHPDDPPIHPRTGMARNNAPIGAALLWAPGYLLSDALVRLANSLGAQVPADGYSWPYIWAVCGMSALYALLGLLLTYRLARRFAGSFAAAAATLTLWLATPLVFYTYISMPWAHPVAFFLVALFLTIWLHGSARVPLAARMALRSPRTWAMLGIVGGLMTITREQMALFLLLPAVEGVLGYARLFAASRQPASTANTASTEQGGNGGFSLQLWQAWKPLLVGHTIFVFAFLLMITPQLLTYQVLNGQPTPDTIVSGKLASSGGISPHFFDTLIDPAHGAFCWSPVLPVALAGLLLLARRDALLAGLLLLGFVVQTYLNGSFGTTWHLSGAFGFRRLIECTPIFAMGLAPLIEWLRQRVGARPGTALVVAGCIMLVYWNAGLIAQWTIVRPEMRSGLIWDGMLSYQFVEVPRQVAAALHALLFDRCQLMQNC
jgi:hypothetical protein